jgi:Secretion system C-terminal sorting domain
MKTLILFSFVFLTIFSLPFHPLHAQAPIPNGDFEQWANGAPVGWFVDNEGTYTPITQTSDANSGSSALEGTVVAITESGVTYGQIPPFTLSGNVSGKDTTGFPYTDRPNSFTGYYKFNPVGGDSLTLACLFLENGVGIGEGSFVVKTSATSYTSFAVPINWASNDAPDTAVVTIGVFAFSTGTSTPNLGSTMEIDDLAFSNQVINSGVSSTTSSFDLQQNYPNPLTNAISTTITYSLDEPGYTTLTVYDINGRAVATPVQEAQSAGNHLATLDCGALAAGVYTYRLTSGDHSSARMLQVLH